MRTILSKILILLLINKFCNGQEVDLTKYLPLNYVTDGSIDYTDFIQDGINENKEIIFPNFALMISEEGLEINSNQIIIFQNKSSLIMKANSRDKYGLLNLKGVKNVTIKNPVLVGDRNKHIGTSGEWGMGINILSSTDINIINPIVSEFWGDGIYIGELNYKERRNYNLHNYFCRNISIYDGLLNHNRRNGISVISVKGLVINNTSIENTLGTMPMAAIDIEPNNNSQFLEDISILNVITKNNKGPGFKYVPSNFYGKRSKNVNISFVNCQDYNSEVGFFIGGARASNKKEINKLKGDIFIKNFKSYSTKTPFRIGSIQTYNPKISLVSFSFFNEYGRDLILEKKMIKKLTNKNILHVE